MKKLFSPKNVFFLTIFIFTVLFITQGEPYVRSDSWCYYAISKNLVEHQNFITSTKPEYWDYMEHLKEKKDGKYISVCSSGTALINLPGIFIANIFEGDKTTVNDYFRAYNGHTIYDGLAVLLTASLIGILSLSLIYAILRMLGYSENLSMAGTFLSFGSSFAVWYIFLLPFFTHIYEIFCVSLILFVFLQYKINSSKKYLPFALGASVSLSILVRPTLAPIGLLVFLFLLTKKDLNAIRKFILGGIPFALIYALYNYISYGSFITSGYSSVRSENFDFSEFNGLNILFSQYRGLFIYSPIFLFSVFGLILLYRKQKWVSAISLIGFLSGVLIYGFWPAWFGGGSFGSRFMIYSVPFFAIGISEFLGFLKNKIKKKTVKYSFRFLIIIFFFYTIGLTFLYRVTITSNLAESYEGKKDGMYSADRYTPFLIYKFHFDLLRNTDSTKSYLNSLYKNVNGGSGLLAIPLGITNAVLRIDAKEETRLILLTPPKMRRQLPNQVGGFYIKNDQIQKFRLTDFKFQRVYNFSGNENYNNLTFEKYLDTKLTLPTNDFSCFILKETEFICFENTDNLQVRGLPLDIEVGQDFYLFQNTF